MSNKGMSAAAAAGTPHVVIERTYRASLAELWALWTTKEGFESWWGPEGFRVEVSALEAHPGGALHYEMIADAPEQIDAMKRLGRPASHAVRARFSEIRPHQRLVITNLIDFLPEVEPYESTIAVDFFPSGASVRMVITLEPLHDEIFTRMSLMGFTSQLTKLDKRFGGQGG